MEVLNDLIDTLQFRANNLKDQKFTVEQKLHWATELADKRAGQLADTTLALQAANDELKSTKDCLSKEVKAKKIWRKVALIGGLAAIAEGVAIWWIL